MSGQTLRLPNGMRRILDARLNGQRPAWAVHVTDDTMVAQLAIKTGFPVVLAAPLNLPVWDWSALRGLDVVLVYRPSGSDPLGAAINIIAAQPSDLIAVPIWRMVEGMARHIYRSPICN